MTDQRVERLILDHLEFVTFVARKIAKAIHWKGDLEDLVQHGTLGLIDAANRFDPGRENRFRTYAEFRIRGAILDGLRNSDNTARSVRDQQKQYELTVRDLTYKLCRPPRSNEIAEALGLDMDGLFGLMGLISPVTIVSIDDEDSLKNFDRKSLLEIIVGGETAEEKIVNKIHLKRQCELVAKYIMSQTPRDREILDCYLFRGMRMNKMARIFRITESRICQIVQKHSAKLRCIVENYEKGVPRNTWPGDSDGDKEVQGLQEDL